MNRIDTATWYWSPTKPRSSSSPYSRAFPMFTANSQTRTRTPAQPDNIAYLDPENWKDTIKPRKATHWHQSFWSIVSLSLRRQSRALSCLRLAIFQPVLPPPTWALLWNIPWCLALKDVQWMFFFLACRTASLFPPKSKRYQSQHPTGRRDKREINIRRNRPPIAARPILQSCSRIRIFFCQAGIIRNALDSHVQSMKWKCVCVCVVLCGVVWLTRLRTILALSSVEFLGMRSARLAVAGESMVLDCMTFWFAFSFLRILQGNEWLKACWVLAFDIHVDLLSAWMDWWEQPLCRALDRKSVV